MFVYLLRTAIVASKSRGTPTKRRHDDFEDLYGVELGQEGVEGSFPR